MSATDDMRLVLGELARRDYVAIVDLLAESGDDSRFQVQGLSADQTHKALGDAKASGLISGEPLEGDGSMRVWEQPALTINGLAWLGMWPNEERPLADPRWWKRAVHVLRDLQQNPPQAGFLLRPLGTNGPSPKLPGADEQTWWMVVTYLLEAGLIRNNLDQEGIAGCAVTPAGEEAIADGHGRPNPALDPLTEGQRELFARIVETALELPHHQREFVAREDEARGQFVAARAGPIIPALLHDVSALESAGLIQCTRRNYVYGNRFVVTQQGIDAYNEARADAADRFAAIEEEAQTYLSGSLIASRYPGTFERWRRAEQLLGSGKAEDLTTVGHTAREALQRFATELIALHPECAAQEDPSKTVARVKAVISLHKEQLGEKRAAMLDALVAYWGAVNDLAQRLEHAAQKDGEPVSREDARQLVHLTAQVIFEIDRTLPNPNDTLPRMEA